MPGLIGITGKDASTSVNELRGATDLLRYHYWYNHKLYEQPHFFLSQITGFDSISAPSHFEEGGFSVWVDGEYFNGEDFSWLSQSPMGLAELLARAVAAGKLDDVLPKIDGDFTAVVYDKSGDRIHIITDRYGLRPLYLYEMETGIIFASELKAFLKFSRFQLKINEAAARSFLNFGHLLGEDSWFENVALVSPATILTLSLSENKKPVRQRYWGWGRINSLEIKFEDAAEQLGEELKKAVRSRAFRGEKFSVLLSGGLDSRVILGLSDRESCAGTITFGEKKCWDAEIAAQVAEVIGLSNTFFEINGENWFNQKIHAVWRCDGLASVTDLHASQFYSNMRNICPLTLNGFLGDPIVGGVYLLETHLNKGVSGELARQLYGNFAERALWDSQYFESPHADPLVIGNRGRRLILSGVNEAALTVHQRKPFMANALVDFAYGLPDDFRLGRKVYYAACQRLLPGLFKKIPYQLTGLTLKQGQSPFWRLTKKAGRLASALGFVVDHRQLFNYPKIFKQKKNREVLEHLLSAKDSLVAELLKEDRVLRAIQSPDFRDWTYYSRLATMEIWLQQVVNGKYRE